MDKKLNLILTGVIIVFLTTGCIHIRSPEELVRRPKITLEEKEILDVIAEFLGENKTLTLAANQREESIRRVDLDGDGAEELFILYREVDYKQGSSEEYGMFILKRDGDKWNEINRISRLVYGFDFVQYEDITGDNRPEIFIGANTENEIEKKLTIYSYHNGYFRDIYYSNYRDFSIGDLDRDKRKEVVIFNKEENSDIRFIEVLKYSDNKLNTLNKYNIQNKSYYSTMSLGKASKNDIGIFIDHDIGTFDGYTDLLIMKGNRLTEVLRNTVDGYYGKFKGNITGSKDINNDGIIEFGSITEMKLIGSHGDHVIPYIKEWYQWDGEDDILLAQREYYNYDVGYKIIIPMEWGEEFIILEKGGEGEVGFYSLNNMGGLGEEIFSLKSYLTGNWVKERTLIQDKSHIVLDENREKIIIGIILYDDEESQYYIDERKLKEMFVKI